jgi:hypothetical protein
MFSVRSRLIEGGRKTWMIEMTIRGSHTPQRTELSIFKEQASGTTSASLTRFEGERAFVVTRKLDQRCSSAGRQANPSRSRVKRERVWRSHFFSSDASFEPANLGARPLRAFGRASRIL